MTTAFVLSGGGSLGAVQVGVLQALSDRDVSPDLLVGVSAGALNAVYIAGRGFTGQTLEGLAGVWRALRRRDVFPFAPVRQLLAIGRARPSICSGRGLSRLISEHLAFERFEDARLPVHVVATDVLSGADVLLSAGDLATAVLASASVPGILPVVEIDGRFLFDGGVANNTPISQAVALGADRVVVIPSGPACGLGTPPRSILAMAVHAVTLLIQQRLILDVLAYQDEVELLVVPPLCPLSVSPTDFRHAALLIERARGATHTWIAKGGHLQPHPERFLALHAHPAGKPSKAGTGDGSTCELPSPHVSGT